MKRQLVYTRRAIRDIKALDKAIRDRVKRGLEKLRENPSSNVEKLSNPELGTFRYRIGDYRVIFDIEGSDIVVLRVGHRKEIYRGGTT